MVDFIRDWEKIFAMIFILAGFISIKTPLISTYVPSLRETITIEWYWFLGTGIVLGLISFI